MAVRREDIEKKSLFYSILRPYVDLLTTTYFRTKVHNFKNVPKDDIIIYAPNHQNALMDALAILATVHTEPVFLARADIFKKKMIEKILTFLRILPIYRIRDGKESLGNNDAIFQKTIDQMQTKHHWNRNYSFWKKHFDKNQFLNLKFLKFDIYLLKNHYSSDKVGKTDDKNN